MNAVEQGARADGATVTRLRRSSALSLGFQDEFEVKVEKFWNKALVLAGLSAIGFFVFFSLYNKWLELPIFSSLSQDQTFILMVIFLVLVFLALISALVFHHKHKTLDKKQEEWMIYQVAFLWHGVSPPSIQEHFSQMTPEIKKTKGMLHEAVNTGQLKTCKEYQSPVGVIRWVDKTELQKYAKLIGESPKFLE